MVFDGIPILEGYEKLEKLDVDDDKSMYLVRRIDGHRCILKVFQKIYKYPIYERLSKLAHENMPAIYGIFLGEDCFYVLEDYVEGRTLQEILESDGVFDKRTATDIISQLCNVLMYLHNQPSAIIHRDIKPVHPQAVYLSDNIRILKSPCKREFAGTVSGNSCEGVN